MKPRSLTSRSRLALFILTILLTSLACQAVTGRGSQQPTKTPTSPTHVEPTSTTPPVEEPLSTATLAPVEEPTTTQEEDAQTAEPTSPPGALPGEINILTVNGFQDEYEDWHIVGLVSNNTERDVSNIEVEVELFDANGTSLYKEVTHTSIYYLAPGEETPFELWVYEDIPAVENYTATVVGNSSEELNRGSVEISQDLLSVDETGDIYLAGKMSNNGDKPVDINGLAVALFNPDGELVNVATSYIVISYLDPGDSAPFRFMLDSSQSTPKDQLTYEYYTDVVITDLMPGFDLVFSEDHTDYLDTFDTFHLVGELTNNSDALLSVYLIAGISDAEGKVLDASSLSLPVTSIAPGETIPYDFDIWGAMSYIPSAYDSASEYSVQVDWGWTYETEYELMALTTEGDENTFDNYQGIFTGKVVNQSGAEVDSAQVIIALYDKSDGRLVATDYTYVSGPIANGASVEYNVYVSIPDGFDPTSVDFVITAKGQKP